MHNYCQSKPLLMQREAISSRLIICYLGEETDPHLTATSFQAEQPQLPQPLPISLVLQTLHQLRCPSLDTLQPLNVSLVVGGPKLNTVFEVRPHQCPVQGTITALLLLATPFLTQARMPLAFLATWAHYRLIFRWLSTSHATQNTCIANLCCANPTPAQVRENHNGSAMLKVNLITNSPSFGKNSAEVGDETGRCPDYFAVIRVSYLALSCCHSTHTLVADFNGNVLGVRTAPLNPSLLANKSQFDLYSANAVIYNLIAHCHWAMLNLSALWEDPSSNLLTVVRAVKGVNLFKYSQRNIN
ncbi:hypothetical protein QYF61_010949 [Mycteria americana]|uniref:Uncharacterized protein n=1 Tax=Mycteria americana TaxID=33587 RepID=A0AAN7MRY8_MYCAM|nr:hypothetical protein QYF61_010949 [Mycteria americana]